MKIIAFSGPKGVGKNFVSKILKKLLIEKGYKVKEDSYAAYLKKFCVEVLGLDKKYIYGNDEQKETLTEYKWCNFPENIRSQFAVYNDFLTVREVMCVFGTQLTRDIWSKDIWTRAIERKIKKAEKNYEYYLITDVRFKNECKQIKDLGGAIIFITGNRINNKFFVHQTESHYNYIKSKANLVIENNIDDNEETIKDKLEYSILFQNLDNFYEMPKL